MKKKLAMVLTGVAACAFLMMGCQSTTETEAPVEDTAVEAPVDNAADAEAEPTEADAEAEATPEAK